MATELEQEFYDTFGIEKRYIILEDDYGQYRTHEKLYPKVTAEKLLEMICIYNNNVYENEKIVPSNINTLKEDVLHWIITDFEGNEKIKHQIQQLFEEEE